MATRRQLLLVGCAAVGLAVAVGSGAFTATSAERGVDVAVVADDEAYLAFPDKQLKCGNPQGGPRKNTIVENQLDTHLFVRITVSVSGGELRIGPDSGQLHQLDSGEETTFEYQLDPGDEATVQVKPPEQGNQNSTVESADDLHVEARRAVGNGIRISVSERTFTVNCPAGSDARESTAVSNRT